MSNSVNNNITVMNSVGGVTWGVCHGRLHLDYWENRKRCGRGHSRQKELHDHGIERSTHVIVISTSYCWNSKMGG